MDAMKSLKDCPREERIYDSAASDNELHFGHLSGKTVLDVGCGSGQLGKWLKSRGNTVYGVTISGPEAELASQCLDGVYLCDLDTVKALPYGKEFFDVIICADVLEHLKEPLRILEILRNYLKQNGELLASIPNIANFKIRLGLLHGRFDYQPRGILDETHLRFYTLKTARALISAAGFSIRKTKYRNWNWNLPEWMRFLTGGYEWEVKQRLTRWWPGLFATQFVIHAQKEPPQH